MFRFLCARKTLSYAQTEAAKAYIRTCSFLENSETFMALKCIFCRLLFGTLNLPKRGSERQFFLSLFRTEKKFAAVPSKATHAWSVLFYVRHDKPTFRHPKRLFLWWPSDVYIWGGGERQKTNWYRRKNFSPIISAPFFSANSLYVGCCNSSGGSI